jgi:hypothetical protein
VKPKQTNTPTKDLATDFFQIHTMITNALASAVSHAGEYEKTGFQNTNARDGFAMFNRCLVALLHIHHRGEDRIFMPYLATHLPDLSPSFVKEQHKEIEACLDRLTVRLEDMAKEPISNESKEKITIVRERLDKLNGLWLAHKDKEEQFITEQAAPRISKEDQEMLMAELQKHGMGDSKPMSVMGAFLFYNFEPDMRAQFFSDMPWHLKDLLVPYIWKPRWGKMKPFMAYPPS